MLHRRLVVNRVYELHCSKGKGKVGVECEMCSGGRVWKKYLQAFIENCRKKRTTCF